MVNAALLASIDFVNLDCVRDSNSEQERVADGRDPRSWGIQSPWDITQVIEHGHAVGLGPKADIASLEGRVLDVDERLAIVSRTEPRPCDLDPQSVPLTRRSRHVDAVPGFAPDSIERAANAVDSLIENQVVLERVGTHHIVVVAIA